MVGADSRIRATGGDRVFGALNAAFLTVLCVLVLYPFVERYFVKGIMIGSIKG